MASNYTENYGLCQWEATDQVLREDFNRDNAKIDAAIAARGNCYITAGTYVGTGESRNEHPNTIITGFAPLLVIISGGSYTAAFNRDNPSINTYAGSRGEPQIVTWLENGVSWYVDSGTGSPSQQMNEEGVTYYYVALG
ncbi:hypothetical protein HMPREF0866_02181 [Ruminococcaceae bacterium D16]|nr:hypothetical protein HMPREF0866_02181 [Ruminococcaceae bacterium D16]